MHRNSTAKESGIIREKLLDKSLTKINILLNNEAIMMNELTIKIWDAKKNLCLKTIIPDFPNEITCLKS